MGIWFAYIIGVTTLPVLFLTWTAVGWVISTFTTHSMTWVCRNCGKKWGSRGDGSSNAVATIKSRWHFIVAHPGYRGRDVVAEWRGWRFPEDRDRFKRLDTAFPSPRVTVVDVAARILFIRKAVYAIAVRHGRKIGEE